MVQVSLSRASSFPPRRRTRVACLLLLFIAAAVASMIFLYYGDFAPTSLRSRTDEQLASDAEVAPALRSDPVAGAIRAEASLVTIEPRESTISLVPASLILTVMNGGPVPIRITRVRPLCGCTVAGSPQPAVVQPGGSSKISVRATPPGVGEKRTAVEVHHDGSTPSPLIATLVLKGRSQSVPEMVRLPQEIVARGSPKSECTVRFQILTTEKKRSKPWLADIVSDSPMVAVSRESIIDQIGPTPGTVRRDYHFAARVQLDVPGRRSVAMLSVLAPPVSEGEQPMNILVMSDCRASVEPIPDTLFATVGRGDIPLELRVWIRAKADDFLELAPEPTGHNWLEVMDPIAAPDGSPFVSQITVRIVELPEANEAAGPATVKVRTNVPGCPAITIPVFIRVKAEDDGGA